MNCLNPELGHKFGDDDKCLYCKKSVTAITLECIVASVTACQNLDREFIDYQKNHYLKENE